MRMNVYSQELTPEIDLVVKRGTDESGAEATFAGVRMFLASPDILHHTPEDDDRSAITFWLPPDTSSFDRHSLADVFRRLATMCEHAETGG